MADASSFLLGNGNSPQDYRVLTPNHDDIFGYSKSGINGVNARPDPQLQAQQQAQMRALQMDQIGNLRRVASGQQQGAGELAVQRQVANALASQQAQARMARGNNAGGAMLQGARQSAALGISGAGMGQQAAMSDQMNANQQLTGALGQGRNQDIQVANANLEAELRARGMNDQQIIAYMQQMNSQSQTELQAQSGFYNSTAHGGAGGGIAAGLGALMVASDERVKEEISDADHEVDDMLDKLFAKSYVYKDQGAHGKGRRVGIMAQDMEKSAAGARVVREESFGKALDLNKAVSATLASVARLNSRLRKVEGRAA